MLFLDTNAVIYIFSGFEKFPKRVVDLIESSDCYISPMVRLELQYLYEVGRSKHNSEAVIQALYKEIGLLVHNHMFDSIILTAVQAPWTRDPFDRIIVSHAACMDGFLVTTDNVIQKHYKKAVWR